MNTVKLKGIRGDFEIIQEQGIFIKLLAIKPQVIEGQVFELPTKIGFKEWQEMGGSLSDHSKIKYTYGELSCHKNQIVN
jgi:hypothetical protein